eukprot:TRINITY_DN338_c0_g2_i2.p1 TRINITY_DN338_c0_g2~~TRINITY_DN338_c0_g2_i2.p1  ORF type:complete len:217 (+),score=48.41 TRINITY_DN338_c0_g2_i2:30-653(+)
MTNAELSFLSEMQDIEILGDTIGNGDLLLVTSPARKTPHTNKKPIDRSVTVKAPESHNVYENDKMMVDQNDDVVDAEYQSVLEGRFIDLRKLYYHTKEQKQNALKKVQTLERDLRVRDAEIASLQKQLSRRTSTSRVRTSSVSSQQSRSSLSSLSTNTRDVGSRKSNTADAKQIRFLQQENTSLKDKLRALQNWAHSIKPPPAMAMK